MLNWNYSNLVQYKGNWYYVKNGAIDWHYTTLAQVNGKGAWYYVKNGAIDWKYTGLAQVDGKGDYYYVQNGKLNWAYTGWIYYKGSYQYLVKGVLHEHSWEAETKTVHHDAVVEKKRVYSCSCGQTFETYEELTEHLDYYDNLSFEYIKKGEEVPDSFSNHAGESSWEQDTEITPAYDEEIVTGYRCSVCGAYKNAEQ